MTNTAALDLLTAIAQKGIDLAVELGKLDPATATEEQINAAGTAALLVAMEAEPAVKEAMLQVTAERMVAVYAA